VGVGKLVACSLKLAACNLQLIAGSSTFAAESSLRFKEGLVAGCQLPVRWSKLEMWVLVCLKPVACSLQLEARG